MYTPRSFQFDDSHEMIAFMKQYSFATIITNKENLPIATHLPFVIDDSSGKLLLTSHLAAANEQTRWLSENESLIIFTEPHAYISPTHYDKMESVPTWDYMAVHAYGKARILEEDQEKIKVLEQMICFYEQSYLEQWKGLSEKYKNGMLKGMVAFEIAVTSIQGQKKLSQNKTAAERQRIVGALEKSGNTMEKDLAARIRRL